MWSIWTWHCFLHWHWMLTPSRHDPTQQMNIRPYWFLGVGDSQRRQGRTKGLRKTIWAGCQWISVLFFFCHTRQSSCYSVCLPSFRVNLQLQISQLLLFRHMTLKWGLQDNTEGQNTFTSPPLLIYDLCKSGSAFCVYVFKSDKTTRHRNGILGVWWGGCGLFWYYYIFSLSHLYKKKKLTATTQPAVIFHSPCKTLRNSRQDK